MLDEISGNWGNIFKMVIAYFGMIAVVAIILRIPTWPKREQRVLSQDESDSAKSSFPGFDLAEEDRERNEVLGSGVAAADKQRGSSLRVVVDNTK